jgi:hypothetical protein
MMARERSPVIETEGGRGSVLQKRLDPVDPLLPDGDGGHGRHAESSFQSLQFRHDPSIARLVRHVHVDHEGDPHLRELDRDQKGPAHVLGVAHLQDDGPGFPHQDVPGHPLVLGHG